MQAMVDQREVAGAVTLVTTKDKIVHLEATGLADIASGRPMQTDALFWLASTTKMFNGVAILMLQDEGKLSLDDSVAKFIPEFSKLRTPSGKPANISIKQLLTHTSGLGKTPLRYYLTGHLSGLVRGILGAPMQFEPGERFEYTNSGFEVAGRIVEVVSGKTFDAFLKERLFDPLGMRDTTFYPNKAQRRRLPTCYFKDWSDGTLHVQAPPAPLYLLFMLPPEELYATAADLARFAQMLLNRGVLNQKRYLSESAYTLLTTNQVGDLADPFIGYGIGVNVIRSPHDGVTAFLSAGTFSHQGAWGTHVIIDPAKGLAYVLLVQRTRNHPSNFDNIQTRAFLQAATGP
jgi:CubicO group peptidase (beta-lactamase class C family)